MEKFISHYFVFIFLGVAVLGRIIRFVLIKKGENKMIRGIKSESFNYQNNRKKEKEMGQGFEE